MPILPQLGAAQHAAPPASAHARARVFGSLRRRPGHG
jgi:hypothetical protein